MAITDRSTVSATAKKIGPALSFERLWKELQDSFAQMLTREADRIMTNKLYYFNNSEVRGVFFLGRRKRG
jgi:hypothetical protein